MRIARCAALVAGLLAAPAHGQWGGSVQVVSDYRFRGVSLSAEKPDARVSVAYDAASGWFAGASATGVELEPGRRRVELLGYVGYAARMDSGPGWEVGASSVHYGTGSDDRYVELFAGLIGERWNLRVHHAPRYFGRDVRTLYVELDGGVPLVGPLRGIGHVGTLWRFDGTLAPGTRRARLDLRAGVSAAAGPLDVQIAWVAAQRETVYAYAPAPRRSTWVLSASCPF